MHPLPRLNAAALADLAGELLGLGQHDRLLQLQTPQPDADLTPERARIRESTNDGFEIELDAVSFSPDAQLDQLIGQEATIRLLLADGSRRPWHGIVCGVARLGSDGGLARHRLVLRPWLQLLGLRRDNFLFQDLDVRDIVSDVFRDYPQAAFRFDVSSPLRVLSTCTQRHESDLQFVLRILAEAGLSFHFEHLDGDDADQASKAGASRHRMVITDTQAARADLGTVRYAQARDSASRADLPSVDTLTHFSWRAQAGTSAVTVGAWNYKQVRGVNGQADSRLARGALPRLERYDGGGAYRYPDADHANRAAEIELQREEQHYRRGRAEGNTRRLKPGGAFALVEHPSLNGRYAVLGVTHEMANNLGSRAARLLGQHELDQGSYRCRAHLQPADVPVVPDFVRQPTARGSDTALVVGLAGEALTTERDGRVKVQRHWQRGDRPNPGGLPHDAGSPDTDGNAPGNEASGTWVRTLQRAAGANFGMPFTPRHATEALVDHLDGDADRPLVGAQLHNGMDTPPFSAGEGSGVNHPGMIDGVHSPTLDRRGYNEWMLDNHTGQLGMRMLCSYTLAEVGLGHLRQQAPASGQRGAARGTGFEASTQGWASFRAAQGLLVSTSLRPGRYGSVETTQMEASEALGLLKGAQALAERLDAAAKPVQAQALGPHEPGQSVPELIKSLDPQQDGKYDSPVNGQESTRPDGSPVERPARPTVLFDSACAIGAVSEAGVASHAGQDQAWVAQGDWQDSAGGTYSLVAGQTASWYTDAGGLQVKAANGSVSLRAHTDELRILADQDVEVVSVNDEIIVRAQSRIELVGGSSGVTLDGANIDFKTPGTFTVKSAGHNWAGGASNAADLAPLPSKTFLAELASPLYVAYDEQVVFHHDLGAPITGRLRYSVVNEADPETSAHGHELPGGAVERIQTEQAQPLQKALRFAKLKFDH